jgi:DNA replication licensing factor MCM6
MAADEITTLYADFEQLLRFDEPLARAIQEDYFRCAPAPATDILGHSLDPLLASSPVCGSASPHLCAALCRPLSRMMWATFASSTSASSTSPLLNGSPLVSYCTQLPRDAHSRCSIRDLKTSQIGRLVAVSGTVVRTSEVRPELTVGTFQCLDCRTVIADVQQQFKYTEVSGTLASLQILQVI